MCKTVVRSALPFFLLFVVVFLFFCFFVAWHNCHCNSSDTDLSKWILAVAWLYMFCKMLMYASSVTFSQCFEHREVFNSFKGFLVVNEGYA